MDSNAAGRESWTQRVSHRPDRTRARVWTAGTLVVQPRGGAEPPTSTRVRARRASGADRGHLAIQELMLRLAKQLGVARFFELPTKPAESTMSADVGWRDDNRRVLILNECWNT